MTGHTYVSIRPKRIRAIQWTGENVEECTAFTGTTEGMPKRFLVIRTGDLATAMLWVKANGTWLPLDDGEWIAKDSLGCYPIKDSVFRESYQKDEPEQPSQPVAEDWQIERHTEKQGCSWSDAWSYFEGQGYDMSDAAPQY